MRLKKKIYRREAIKGQAISETLISIGALCSILLASGALYQILRADITANKVARVAAWHGTLYQGETEEQFEARVIDNVRATLMTAERPIRDLMNHDAEDLAGSPDDIAFRHHSTDPTYIYPSNRSSYIANMAGLNQNRVSGVSISIPLADNAEIFKVVNPTNYIAYTTTDNPLPYDPIEGGHRFHVKANAALLSNGFVPMNEAEFGNAISRISADGTPMSYFEPLRRGLSLIGFREVDAALGPDGLSTVAEEQSRVLPAELGTFVE